MNRAQYFNTICYLILRVFARDWHAVWDAAIDLHAQEQREPGLRAEPFPPNLSRVSKLVHE